MSVNSNHHKNCDCFQVLNEKLEDFSAKSLYDKWIPKKAMMKFFDYGETQMLVLEKENGLITSKIRGRKFYCVQSILLLIEKNIITKAQ
jgi:hypothetical protein